MTQQRLEDRFTAVRRGGSQVGQASCPPRRTGSLPRGKRRAVVLVIVLIVVAVFGLVSIYWKSRLSPKKPVEHPDVSEPPLFVREYTSDVFDQIKWRWEWILNPFTNKYELGNFIPYCPKDDCRLVSKDYPPYWNCPICNKNFHESENDKENRRGALIEYRIREKFSSGKTE